MDHYFQNASSTAVDSRHIEPLSSAEIGAISTRQLL